MRPALVLALGLLAACGDPGPRDRSLKPRLDRRSSGPSPLRRTNKKRRHTTSVIGLVSDPLAQLYAEGAPLVVRFDDITSIMREAAPRLAEVRRVLPQLGLPGGTPAELLRRALRLPDSVVIDPLRPFAFVLTERGWAAIVPARSREEAADRLRALDGIHCVAGDPAVVAAYKPGYRKGFYLPGDCSIVAKPSAIATIGSELTAAFGKLGVDLTFLDGLLTTLPADIERVDLALRFSQMGLRVDVRLAPNRDSATSLYLERMKLGASDAAAWLPSDGTLYFELGTAALEWEGLLLNLMRDTVQLPSADEAPELNAMRNGLSLLDRNTGVMLDLDPDGSGRLFFVACVEDPSRVKFFLKSQDFQRVLELIAGPGGHLEWMPDVFSRGGVQVGAVTGHVSRRRLMAWREGTVLQSTLSILMRGPAVAYVAVVDGKLCMVTGQRARAETERFLDTLRSGRPVRNEHFAEVDPLFKTRLAAFSMDLAALFDGCREAAPNWHQNGRALRRVALRWRLPAAGAVTVEGGALRLAARVPPRMLADGAAKILSALAEAADGGSED